MPVYPDCDKSVQRPPSCWTRLRAKENPAAGGASRRGPGWRECAVRRESMSREHVGDQDKPRPKRGCPPPNRVTRFHSSFKSSILTLRFYAQTHAAVYPRSDKMRAGLAATRSAYPVSVTRVRNAIATARPVVLALFLAGRKGSGSATVTGVASSRDHRCGRPAR